MDLRWGKNRVFWQLLESVKYDEHDDEHDDDDMYRWPLRLNETPLAAITAKKEGS